MRLSRTNFSDPFDPNAEQPAEPEAGTPMRVDARPETVAPAPQPVPIPAPMPVMQPPIATQPLPPKTETPRPIYGARVEDRAGRENADEMAALEIEGRSDAPVWQSAFVLKPNVRFTRTPESAYARKQQPAAEPKAVAETVTPETVPAEAVEDVATPIAAVPVEAPAVENLQPAFEEERGALALALRLRREFSTASSYRQETAPAPELARAPVAEIDLVCFPQQGDAEAPRLETTRSFPFPVSNHVFWEAMLMEPDLDIFAPAARWIPPEIASPANSVTALYREIGISPSNRAAAPVSPPIASAIAAPVVEPSAPLQLAAPLPAPLAAVAVEQKPVAAPVPAPLQQRIRPKFALPQAEAIVSPAPKFSDAQMKAASAEYEFPPIDLLQEPKTQETAVITQEALEQSAGLLESVLEDFGIRGEIIDVRPGPVVTMYEFEPAPGVKSSRVIGLSDDIARSMSALSARVAVVPGRNVIGIELPNPVRETVYFRELIESEQYVETRFKLALCLGKTIGGEPVVAELAKMPHLLVAGTTGSGKSVAINTMILSLLYRLKPEECRLIMVDPKMLELSVYDGIPHLLTPVVTDPKKAVMALKWAVREMEDRYRKMSRLGVRNIDGYNARAATARAKGETILCSVQTGFDRATGEAVFEQEEMDLAPMPYIVVIVDEMADLMMVAGKEIEGAIQRLAQMARAAGIHLIMATQRPSVDVITGTIKANFPTRISFQVTSKIDSRTILGEQGAEHLLGQGDMLHMVGGGRIARVHGPFVSDEEVEKVVAHLKTQGRPEYLGTVTEDADEADELPEEDSAVFDKGAMAEEDGNDLYDKAVKVVLRDKKCSTSYIQRRLSIGYNRAASLVERMEKEGLVGSANHVGKRAIIAGGREPVEMPRDDMED